MAKKPTRGSRKQREKKHEEPFWKPFREEKKKARPGKSTAKPSSPPARKPARRKETGPTPPRRPDLNAPMRLNRYIAQCGVCARREADVLISRGLVKVNGEVVTEMGVRVIPKEDKVEVEGREIRLTKYVYVLLNKPKNMITTTRDPKGRKTVLQAIEEATAERVYPVGRLDRNTTGLLLLTNDGELAERLTHPSHKVRKLYHVKLDKPVVEDDLQRLMEGIELEDGLARVDKVDYVMGAGPEEVGVSIHIGRNRIVRRMFEALGYKVVALDRVGLAHLTKKNLPRGKWRLLTDKEVGFLKMI